MYNRILIPTDGSEGTEQAVARAVGIAQTFGSDVHVLYVVDTRPYSGIDLADEEALEQAAIQAGRKAITEIRERVDESGIDLTQATRTGVPHVEILEYTDANEIDLVVMGTHGRTGAELAALGSTTERVLRGVDIPVLTTNLTGGPDDSDAAGYTAYDDILVPTDGSDTAGRAAEHALRFAEQYGATIHALYVVDTSVFNGEDAPRSVLGPLREGGQNAVTEIKAMASEVNIPVSTHLVEGKPAERILDSASEIDADLITMGRRGRTGLPEVPLGRTTERVVRRAETPVLTVL